MPNVSNAPQPAVAIAPGFLSNMDIASETYSVTVAASGGLAPYTYAITAGSLPSGITLNASTGVISGDYDGPAGVAAFTITATDSTPFTPLTGTKTYSISLLSDLTPTQVDICNLALLRLGQGEITALDDGSKEGAYCGKFWDACRRAVLRDYPWSFATISPQVLVLTGNTPIDFQYEYFLPGDCVRALNLYDPTILTDYPSGDISLETVAEQTEVELMFYEIRAGRALVTNLNPASLKYVADVADTTMFDKMFVEAFSYRLAIDLALPITNNASFAQAMTQLYQRSMAAARATDAKESRQKLKVGRAFLQARR